MHVAQKSETLVNKVSLRGVCNGLFPTRREEEEGDLCDTRVMKCLIALGEVRM